MNYRTLAAACALALLSVASCSNPAADVRSDVLAQEIRTQALEHFVRTFATSVPERAVAWAEEQAHTPTIEAMIAADALAFEDDPALQSLVSRAFAARAYEHLFLYGTELTPDGQAVVDALRDAASHGLAPERYHVDAIQRHLDVLAAAGDTSSILEQFQLSVEDEGLLFAHLRDRAALDDTLPADDAAFRLIATPSDDNPLPQFSAALQQLSHTFSTVAESVPMLELLLADGYLRYASDMKYSNLRVVPRDEREARGWDVLDETQQGEIRLTLLAESFDRAAGDAGFAAELAALPPAIEQYERLRAGLETYYGYLEAGGWDPIPGSREWTVGRSGPEVRQLRARLAAEDYFEGPLDSDVFDSALSDAVKAYQATHQLRETGTMTGESYASMNIPVERRIAQIQLSMDRVRQSPIVEDLDRDYVWVNIPDFHAELWDAGERVRRWRVVVGRERWRRGRRGQREIAGRTPTFSDQMLYVVFNPYWNVPPEIRREEYDALIEADPNWLVDNNFEIHVGRDGAEHLRQLPGPSNALGLVKFLFPNEHDVYMHDTPSRSLFDRPTRAFSHGCVRVEDPMELAELLLARDRGWSSWQTRRFIDEKMSTGEEEWVTLREPLPVHIDYIGVRGADDGWMHFLADPYGRDRPEVDVLEDALRARLQLPARAGATSETP